jgi:DNA-binding NtrC family response regulator
MAFSFLILEEEAAFVRRFKNTIESIDLEGKIYATSDVKDAFEIAQHVNIDIFLVDIALEDINGLTGLEFIKAARKIHKFTPIIVVSASLEMQQIIYSFNDLKVFAYIDKRFDAGQVEIELKKAVEVSKLFNHRTISLKKRNHIKIYLTRNIICIQRVPYGMNMTDEMSRPAVRS